MKTKNLNRIIKKNDSIRLVRIFVYDGSLLILFVCIFVSLSSNSKINRNSHSAGIHYYLIRETNTGPILNARSKCFVLVLVFFLFVNHQYFIKHTHTPRNHSRIVIICEWSTIRISTGRIFHHHHHWMDCNFNDLSMRVYISIYKWKLEKITLFAPNFRFVCI